MQGSTFSISIPNLPKLQEALADYPAISTPIVQNAVVAAQAILAKFTTAATVPIKTGYLVQNWAFEIGNLHGAMVSARKLRAIRRVRHRTARHQSGEQARACEHADRPGVRPCRPPSRHEGKSVHGTHCRRLPARHRIAFRPGARQSNGPDRRTIQCLVPLPRRK